MTIPWQSTSTSHGRTRAECAPSRASAALVRPQGSAARTGAPSWIQRAPGLRGAAAILASEWRSRSRPSPRAAAGPASATCDIAPPGVPGNTCIATAGARVAVPLPLRATHTRLSCSALRPCDPNTGGTVPVLCSVNTLRCSRRAPASGTPLRPELWRIQETTPPATRPTASACNGTSPIDAERLRHPLRRRAGHRLRRRGTTACNVERKVSERGLVAAPGRHHARGLPAARVLRAVHVGHRRLRPLQRRAAALLAGADGATFCAPECKSRAPSASARREPASPPGTSPRRLHPVQRGSAKGTGASCALCRTPTPTARMASASSRTTHRSASARRSRAWPAPSRAVPGKDHVAVPCATTTATSNVSVCSVPTREANMPPEPVHQAGPRRERRQPAALRPGVLEPGT